jgi:hypothetical protein
MGPQADLLVSDGPPQALEEDIVAPGALAIHADPDLARGWNLMKSVNVNWRPWSVSKIPGLPCVGFRSAVRDWPRLIPSTMAWPPTLSFAVGSIIVLRCLPADCCAIACRATDRLAAGVSSLEASRCRCAENPPVPAVQVSVTASLLPQAIAADRGREVAARANAAVVGSQQEFPVHLLPGVPYLLIRACSSALAAVVRSGTDARPETRACGNR